jgi:two-component system, OmpR family, response regulator
MAAMPVKVLYVDDDPFLREIAEILLGRRGDLDVHFVDSGEAALRHVDKGDWIPDVIVLDVCMPGLDGLSTYEEMKKRHALANARYAFVSGLGDLSGRERLPRNGEPVIKKPFDTATFAEKIAKLAGDRGA